MSKCWSAAVVCATILCISNAAAQSITPSRSVMPSSTHTIVLSPSGTPPPNAFPTPILSPSPSPWSNQNDSDYDEFSLNETCHMYCQGDCDPYGNGTCSCRRGAKLVGLWTCTVCPQGTYGHNCSSSCNCSYLSLGNRCNPVDGSCLCSSCFSSNSCAVANGTSCINKYLALDNAGKAAYLSTYGAPPLPPPGLERHSIAGLIGGQFDTYTPVYNVIPRTNARTLLQTQVTLDKIKYGTGHVASLLSTLQSQVKSGQLRTTLIIQDVSSTYAIATLNT
ncbi:hypothetical protein EMCRGX_G002574 [Ephydatia muelleri]